MRLADAMKASRTLGQAINRSGLYNVMVVENDDELFQLNRHAVWYTVSVMKDLTVRKCFEPLYDGHLGLADIELYLRRPSNHPSTADLNPDDWEGMH
jgi:hypothetical protein